MSPKRVTVRYPDSPLTLRNLRLGLAGRLGKPFTQAQLAKKIRYSQSHLANVERGSQLASQQMLFAISEVLDTDLSIVRDCYAGSRERLDRAKRASKRETK